MSLLRKKLAILYTALIGYVIKWKIDILGAGNMLGLTPKKNGPQLIVSLTSYGRRVKKVVYYTLVSLLKQEMRPDRIILWVDSDQWNENNLPKKLRLLTGYGIEIRFCEDIRSYKKLIPSLKDFSNDLLVSVDDDVYYPSRLLKRLYEGYLLHPADIQCVFYKYPTFDDSGQITPYNNWPTWRCNRGNMVFPVGAGGILYPPNSLYPDVTRDDLFMKLCPMADDIWFWFMALKQGTKQNVVSRNRMKYYAFDNLYQYFHKSAALTYANSKQNQNDVQLRNLFEYYGIKNREDLLNMCHKENAQ